MSPWGGIGVPWGGIGVPCIEIRVPWMWGNALDGVGVFSMSVGVPWFGVVRVPRIAVSVRRG